MTGPLVPQPRCAALVATKDRWPLLTGRALPSIRSQTCAVERVVIVNDGRPFAPAEVEAIAAQLAPLPATVLGNHGHPGAAGAWNSGLRLLRGSGYDGYVAILDDDDAWDAHHVLCNLSAGGSTGAHLVISGLRRVVAGALRARPLPVDLSPGDFLRGNPGLQGSNTFVGIAALEQAGNFTEGLPSLNDRVLAIRLLRVPGLRVAYTGQWTATWHHGDAPGALSTPRSPAKIAGLRMFWKLHGAAMNAEDAGRYFDRAWRFFVVGRAEIVEEGA